MAAVDLQDRIVVPQNKVVAKIKSFEWKCKGKSRLSMRGVYGKKRTGLVKPGMRVR